MAENLGGAELETERTAEERTRNLLKEAEVRKPAAEEPAPARKEIQQFTDRMSTLFAKFAPDGSILMINRAAILISGMAESDLLGANFLDGPWFKNDPQAEAGMRQVFQAVNSGQSVTLEHPFFLAGRILQLNVTLSPVKDETGRVLYIVGEALDVTALKHAQAALNDINERLEERVREQTESLRAALEEKDLLFKEVHHRVKNNLQIISSLLSLQSEHVRDPEVAGLLADTRSRIKSMAIIHERLYAGLDSGRLGFSSYVRDLAADLVRSSEGGSTRVILDFDLQETTVDFSQAIPCGLSIHELVANSLKHAFPGGRSRTAAPPRLAIRCRPLPLGGLVMEVEDNGVGLPEGFDSRKSRTLGLQLVLTLVRQLKGGLELERIGGTRFRITVPPSA